MIHPTAILGDGLILEGDVLVGAYVVLGVDGPDVPLRIGPSVLIRSHSVIYRGTTLGARTQTGHCVFIREATTIGNDVSIGTHSVLEHHVTIGDGVRLHSRCFVPEHSVLEERAWLGPGVIVTNARFPNRPDTKSNLEGVVVEADAVVGAGVVLLPGVRLGRGCLVGAGSVVTKDVSSGATVVGNPAKERRR